MTKDKKSILALVLPGGGLGGVNQSIWLDKIDQAFFARTGTNLIDKAYVISGVSIGSFNSALLDNKINSLEVYKDNAGKVLIKNSLTSLLNGYYSNKGMQQLMDKIIGTQTFDQTNKKLFFISSSLQGLQPTIWTNLGTKESRMNEQYCIKDIDKVMIKDAILASASLPWFIESHTTTYDNNVSTEVDGVALTNTTSLSLLTHLMKLEKIEPSQIVMLSVACGKKAPKDLSDFSHNVLKYCTNLDKFIKQQIASQASFTDNCTKQLLEASGGKFLSFDPTLKEGEYLRMLDDSHENITRLEKLANDIAERESELINEIVDQLVLSLT